MQINGGELPATASAPPRIVVHLLREVRMGAGNFEDMGSGSSAEDAYASLCRDAEYEEGHGRNGTISTTRGFYLESEEALPMSVARRRGDWLIATDDPSLSEGGKCACFPVAEDSAFNSRVVSISIDSIPSSTFLRDVHALAEVVEPMLRDQNLLLAGEDSQCFTVKVPTPKLQGVVETRPGKTVTRYMIVARERPSDDINFCGVYSPLARGFATLEAACEALAALVKAEPAKFDPPERTYDIVGVVLREDGGGLVHGARRIDTTDKPAIKVTLFSPKAGPIAPTAWLFVGWAAE